MGRKKSVVKWQDGSTDPYNESYKELVGKDYWSHMQTKAPFGFTDDGSVKESPSSNPDMFSDEDVERNDPSRKGTPQPSAEERLLDEAKKLLTDKQAQVWQAVMVEEYTTEETGDFLGVTQQMVSKHLAAARKKIIAYCAANKHRIKAD